MFDKNVYIQRRKRLKELVGQGVILLMGNNESPCNYPGNCYYPMRQDSTFLYYFGLRRDGLAAIIDVDNDQETLIGDDIDIDDIVWYGSVDAVSELAAQAGVSHSAPMKRLQGLVDKARNAGRKIHFLPPYRHDIQIQLMDLLGLHPAQQKEAASAELIKAVVAMRQVKEDIEIAEIEKACETGYRMHTAAMKATRQGVTEKYVGGIVDGMAHSLGEQVSFATIFTQHGEIMHGTPSYHLLENGRLALCDAGAENAENYCSDNTRTYPVNGRFSQRQLEIYSIVEECHDHVLEVARPGTPWRDVHVSVCWLMAQRLKELGLMKGDTEAAVMAGAHALFMPHGLGHMMGLDVHDMEGLGQNFVGFDDEIQPSTQFGLGALRCGKRLQKGFVMTDEPGIYFIPALIDDWRSRGLHTDFIDYDRVETYKDFGGIRLEDDILITDDGCRYLSEHLIPYHPKDVEAFMAE